MHSAFESDALLCLDDVTRFARSLGGASDGDDLVQETYLRAFQSRHTWKEGAHMRRWLFTICKNVFLRAHERQRDTVELEDDASNETLAAVWLHNDLVSAGEAGLFDRIDVAPAIRRAIGELPAVFRATVALVDLEGYDYAEASAILEVPIGTVRSRLFRARRMLQQSLREHARDAGIASAGHPPHGSAFA